MYWKSVITHIPEDNQIYHCRFAHATSSSTVTILGTIGFSITEPLIRAKGGNHHICCQEGSRKTCTDCPAVRIQVNILVNVDQ
jgi:hypothetical protein